jgi:hypothetical protein
MRPAALADGGDDAPRLIGEVAQAQPHWSTMVPQEAKSRLESQLSRMNGHMSSTSLTEGPINRDSFAARVGQFLIPELEPGSHKAPHRPPTASLQTNARITSARLAMPKPQSERN